MSSQAKRVLWTIVAELVLASLLWGFLLWFGNAMWAMEATDQSSHRSGQALDTCEVALQGRFDAAGSVERGEMGPAFFATSTGNRVVEWKVQAQFVSHGTSTAYWCDGDESDGSLRVLKIEKG